MILRLLAMILALLLAAELGVRHERARHKPDGVVRRISGFWLADPDGRVNYSRATSAVGLFLLIVTFTVGLAVYTRDSDLMVLITLLTTACAVLGINLAQFGITQFKAIKLAQGPPPPPPAPEPTTKTTTTTETKP